MPQGVREDMALTFRELETGGETGREVATVDNDTGAVVEREDTSVREIARDTGGRFSPRVPSQDNTENQEVQEVQPKGKDLSRMPVPAPTGKGKGQLTAPVSWKPEEREHWPTMKPEQQAAVLRRERETDAVLRTSAEARKFQEDFNRAIDPYRHMITAENATPLQAVESLFRTAALLRTGAPGAKVKEVGDLIVYFGIDIPSLDRYVTHVLQGMAPGQPQQQAAPVAQLPADVQDFISEARTTRQRQLESLANEAQTEFDTFMADPVNEFANDVRDDMADLLDLATKRGKQLSLQDAYKRATLAHPTISKIILDRQQSEGPTQQTAAARRAIEVAASITNSGGAPSRDGEVIEGDDIRSAVAASIKQLSNRR